MTDENTRLPSDSELLPCPFCGGDARLNTRSYTDHEADVGNAYVDCIGCGMENPWRLTAVGATNAWNTRTALAAQPRDDVREALKDPSAVHVNMLRGEIAKPSIPDIVHVYGSGPLREYLARTYEPVSQGDEQPAIPDMTDAECATAYRDLRKRANDAGFATVGEWIDEQPDTDGLAAELAEMAAALHSLHPVLCEPSEAEANYERATIAFSVLRQRIRTDRKAVLEEAAKVAEERFLHGILDDWDKGYNNAVSNIAGDLRALAEGAGK